MNFKLNLRLFEGEGGGSSAPATAPGSAEGNQNPTSIGRKSKGETSNVVYGKQTADGQVASATTPNAEQVSAVDREAEFNRLISEDYKDLFTKRTQDIINKRFKETKNLEKYQSDVSPILEAIANKYGVDSKDLNALTKAIESDDVYWEELADAEGLTVEQYKFKQKLERENAQYKQMIAKQEYEQKAQSQYQQWLADAEGVKTSYPEFDLRTECGDARFVDLLAKGIDMKTAYEVIHMNDIKTNVAKQAKNTVVNTVRANGARPSENGTLSQSGIIVKNDVSQLSKADRAEIARRVARGEHIKF